jgi:hypothetical protein
VPTRRARSKCMTGSLTLAIAPAPLTSTPSKTHPAIHIRHRPTTGTRSPPFSTERRWREPPSSGPFREPEPNPCAISRRGADRANGLPVC